MRVIQVALLAVLLAPLPASGQQPAPQQISVAHLGPQVGDSVPDFQLPDAQGHVWTRDSLMGPKGAMLVFSRSLDWCPYCKTQAIELQTRAAELKAQGLGLALITYDSPAILADFAHRRGITFPLLSDAGSHTIKVYGILNTTVAPDTSNYGIPFPGTFLLNRGGKVTSRFFEEAYQDRTTVSTILIATGSASVPTTAQHVESGQIDITAYISDEVVAPGSQFSVVFDVTPHPGVHVYAPGAKDYKAIAFTLKPNALLTTRPVLYPSPETYYFKPLDERVSVFQKPFRLVQNMSVSASPETRSALNGLDHVTIAGTLEYQACDDRLCFTPQSIPLSFIVALRPLDTQRTTVPK